MNLHNWAKATELVTPIRWWAIDRRAARVIGPITGSTWIVLEKV